MADAAANAPGNAQKPTADEVLSVYNTLEPDEQDAMRKEVRRTAKNISLLEKEHLEYFIEFDLNGDGFIDEHELWTVMNSLGMSVPGSEIRRMIRHVDEDRDGKVSVQEFFKFIAYVQTKEELLSTEAQLREAYQMLDFEGLGHITARDLTQLYLSMGEKISLDQANEMLKIADVDQDGKVDFNDFCNMIKS